MLLDIIRGNSPGDFFLKVHCTVNFSTFTPLGLIPSYTRRNNSKEYHLKILIISAVALLSFNTFARDMTEKHESFCETEEVKAVKGEKGSCRILLAPEPAQPGQGVCVGLFKGAIPCSVVYAFMKEGAAMQLVCGDAKNPAIDQMMGAKAAGYSVSAIVTKEDGTDIILQDKGTHSVFEAGLVSLSLSKYDEKTSAEISINLRTGIAELTNVVCR
jgi:hypothetical protein